LKRSFKILQSHRLVLAPLEIESVMETARWSAGDPLNVIDQTARFNSTLLYLSVHSKNQFDSVKLKFEKYCLLMRNGSLFRNGEQLFLNYDPRDLFFL